MRIDKLLILLFLIQIKLIGQETIEVNRITIGESFEIYSQILNEQREIYVYLPQGLWGMDEKTSNLPVIYVLDGESQFNHTATTVDFMSAAPNGNDVIPRSIVVGIPNTNRVRDLTPIKDENFEFSGGGKQFLEFITKEVIPHIDSTYQTTQHRTIIGHSLGGLLTFEALLRKREYFNNYISIDPGFGLANQIYLSEVIDTLNQTNLKTENIFISIANNRPTFLTEEEMIFDTSQLIKNFGLPNEKFKTASESKDWSINIKIKTYPNETHYSIPHPSTYDGLKELYHFYSYKEIQNYYHPEFKSKRDLVDNLKKHYTKLSEKMGYEVKPMQGYINSFAYGLNHFDREDLAIDLLLYNLELNPKNPIVHNNLGYFYMTNDYTKEAIEIYSKSLELKNDDWVSETIEKLKRKD